MIISRKLKLVPTQEQKLILEETLQQYKQAISLPLSYGFQNKISNGTELHKYSYFNLREQTQLPSQLICSARCKATEILKSIRTKTKGKFNTKEPKSHCFPTIRFDRNSCSIKENTVKFTTIQGRIEVDFLRYPFVNQNWKNILPTCELQYKYSKDEWYLTVFLDIEPQQIKNTNTALGIDRGCKHIAVLSNSQFFNSKELLRVKGKYNYLRKKLQSKGTKSAKRLLRKLSGKENRFVRDVNHQISKQIVNLPFGTFVLEKLNIKTQKKNGKKFNKILSGWSWKQLETFLAYKAELVGKKVEYVDARYTSQKCSQCGHIEKSNRKSQSLFTCKRCSFNLNADLNASRNIKQNYLTTLGISSSSRVSSITHTSQLLS